MAASGPAPAMTSSTSPSSPRTRANAGMRYRYPFCASSRPTLPMIFEPGAMPSSARTSAGDRDGSANRAVSIPLGMTVKRSRGMPVFFE